MALDSIKNSIEMAKMAVDLDPLVEEALSTVVDFIEGIFQFLAILLPSGRGQLDQYCTGIVFGLQGSKLLVNVANTLMFKPKGQKFGDAMPDGLGDTFKNLKKGMFKTAMKAGQKFADEL